ncbi:MAG: hypothetical protein COT28_00850 [Methylobacterium sp. CG08_land_8_20_14_0_20_71_15]|nr:MAG: hypothetical protein COT56_12705 [Methylobacterium sp. CG09_land_8_20_14_0_10_71_15]PIU16339.1 MAG: hypothetical protein COT28_00850 [Methylobacterium sp. CG08_land_8_20_14_0_20_71_15]
MKSDPDVETKMGQRLIAKYHGRAAAEEAGRAVAAYYANDFDKDGGDLPGYLKGVRENAVKANGGNPYFAGEFDSAFHNTAQQVQAQQVRYRAERSAEATQETVQAGWLGTVDQGIKAGSSPEAIAAAVRQSYETNRHILKVSFPDQDRALLGVIGAMKGKLEADPANADQYLAVVKALAGTDRVDAQGKKLGTLEGSSTIGPQVSAAVASFEAAYGQRRDRATVDAKHGFWSQADRGELDEKSLRTFFDEPRNKGAMTEGEYQGYLRLNERSRASLAAERAKQAAKELEKDQRKLLDSQALDAGDRGSLWTLKDQDITAANGEAKTVSAKDQQDAAVSGFLDREQFVASRGAGTPAQREAASFARKVEWFSRNGQENPEWSDVMKRGAVAGNSVMVGGELPQVLREGFQTYRRLAAAAPQLALAQAGSEAAKFYDVADTLVSSGVQDEGTALATAVAYHRDPSKFESVTARVRSEEVRSRIAGIASNPLGLGFNRLAGVSNIEAMSTETQKLADIYVKVGGMGADEAVKRAAARVEQNFTNVNGHAVRTADRRVPPDFGSLAGEYLKRYAEERGATVGREVGDLSIAPMPNSATNWMVVDRITGLPVEMGPRAALTLDDLRAVQEVRADKARLRAERASADRLKPLVVIPGTGLGVSKPSLRGYSPEEVAGINLNIDAESTAQAERIREGSLKRSEERAKTEAAEDKARAEAPTVEPSNPFKPSILLRDSKRARKQPRE